ncbi:MAG: hypothetical protein AAGH89_19220 [Verrucomicrobiota bacterium]
MDRYGNPHEEFLGKPVEFWLELYREWQCHQPAPPAYSTWEAREPVPTEVSAIALEQQHYALEMASGPEFRSRVKQAEYEMNHRLFRQLSIDIFTQKTDPIQIKVHRDWWQAFKDRWFPAWALELWPVEYDVHQVTLQRLYPMLAPKLRGQATFLQFRHETV